MPSLRFRPRRFRPRRRAALTGVPASRLAAGAVPGEAVAGIVQRPPRAALTMLGTILGVGAFVAVLGLTATAAGQISKAFTIRDDTTVTVQDNGPANDVAPPGTNPAIGFPAGADQIAGHIRGVAAAGRCAARSSRCVHAASSRPRRC